MTMAGDEPDTRTTATGHDAETMLDFVNPAGVPVGNSNSNILVV
jgi:hypothetical protein